MTISIDWNNFQKFCNNLDQLSPTTVKLGELCHKISSGTYSAKSLNHNAHSEPSSKIYPVYGATGIIHNSSDFTIIGRRILIGRVGNPGFVHHATGKFNVSDNALILELNEELCDFSYIFFYLTSIKEKLHALARGAAQKCLAASALKQIDIKLPPLEIQKLIGNFFDIGVANAASLTRRR